MVDAFPGVRPDSRDSLVYHGANDLTLLRFADSHIRATRDLVRDEAGAARDSYGKDANDRVGCRVTEPVRFEAACVSSRSRRCATALEGQGSSYVEERQQNSSERFSHQSYGGHRCHRRASAFPPPSNSISCISTYRGIAEVAERVKAFIVWFRKLRWQEFFCSEWPQL
jgi:hypothetical protein